MVSLNSMVLGLAALVATSVSAETTAHRTLSSLPVHALPSFDYAALQQGDTPQRLLAAITTDGIVALKNVPNYANLRDNFLRRAVECALRGYEAPSEHTPRVSRKLFADGTKRYTISTNAGRELRAMHDESFAGCPGYASRYLALSLAVEHAVNTFGAALDLTSFRVSDGERPISSRQLVSEAVRLDHFHAYEAAPTGSSAVSDLTDGGDARDRRRLMDMSLPLHEDHGLFIAMSAPKWFEVDESSGPGRRLVERELASDASGLIIQTSSGQRVRPVLQSDELVIMMGTGASRWLRTSHAVPAVLHGMRMPEALVASSDAGRRSLRAWFGKMTLLPAYQRMLESGAPFERHLNATTRHLLTDDSYELKTVGCATGRHLAASEGSCTLRQCSTKAGVAAPEEPCSVICNRVGHSDSDASTCAEKCTCNNAPGTAEVCWMLCVGNLPSDVCALDKQTCSGQKIVCSVPTSAPPAPTTPAPTTKAPVPTTQAPTPTTQAPAPTTPAPTTASPVTPGPTTKSPSTPAPTTSSPTTPGPTTATPTPTEPQHC